MPIVIDTHAGTTFASDQFQRLELRPGLTIMGDSYSLNFSASWTHHMAVKVDQYTSAQGASVDDKYAHAASMPESDRKALPSDLVKQAQQLKFLTDRVIIWLGVNDLMTLHTWSTKARRAATHAELNTMFGLVDALIASGVQRLIIPNVIDISQSPGLKLARGANITVSEETTLEALHEWNDRLKQEVAKRPQVSSIDFFKLTREWLANPQAVGLKSITRIEEDIQDEYVWQDFLHMTPWVHRNLIAPQFETALQFKDRE